MQIVNAVSLCCAAQLHRAVPLLPSGQGYVGTPGGASISTARSENRDEGDRLFDFGKYKGRSFRSVYDNEPSYVNWTLDEMQKGEGYCKGMRRW